MKSPALVALVLTVDALAIAGAAVTPTVGLADAAGTVLLLALLAGLVASRPVFVPALKTEVACSDAFTLCAVATLGPLAGAAVAVGIVIGAAAGQDRRPSGMRLAFNLGALPLSVLGAGWVFGAVGGAAGDPLVQIVWPLTAATVTYFALNSGLVSLAVALDKGTGVGRVFRDSFLWTAVAAALGLTLAVVLVGLLRAVGPWGFVVGLAPAWLLATFYRANRDRIEEQVERIERVEGRNVELECRVAERTREIQSMLTHVEAVNQELRDTNQRLVEAGRIKSEFLAKVSHELRTPLNAVLGFSELLSDPAQGALTPQQREFLADIHDSGEHLLHLINNILDLSKLEAGRLEARLEEVDTGALVREAAAMLHPAASRKGILLTHACEAAAGRARLDPGMFREVLINLVGNAVKFTPAGGQVRVSAARRGPDLQVEVQDSGIGIAPDHVQRIFEEFYQVDGSYARRYEGTGLGLTLVRRLVGLHQGRVTVESTVGSGTVFRCIFPDAILEVAAPRAVAEPRADGAAAGPRTVLVVEDNALNRKLARNALRPHGWRVLEATNGEEALALLGAERPDLVLMDLQLPGMDGLEATRRIKADPRLACVPVVALTAHVKEVDERQAREAGCVAYITKPIRITQIAAQLEAILAPQEALA